MAPKETLRSLWAQIENNRLQSTSGKYFVPMSSLRTIFTPLAIAKAVAELQCQPEDRVDLRKAIQDKGIITFAILVWMHQEDAITSFWVPRVLDARLPLDKGKACLIAPEFGTTFATETQWEFLPHSFQSTGGHYQEIDAPVILPFIRQVEPPVIGGFGTVFKEEICPVLQDFYPQDDGPVVVVRKILHQRGSREQHDRLFKNEKAYLSLLNCLKHPNIIPLLASYTQDYRHNFLFPLLDMDLDTFFKKRDRYGNFCWDFTFFSALYGLASALSSAHNVNLQADRHGLDFEAIGYHHDLRPANILVNKERFVLADFGLGRLKPAGEPSTTHWKAGAGDYLAPECMDENFVHQDVGRAIDVWAFGCLMAEVATFIHMGPDGLLKFLDLRKSAGPTSNWANSYFYDQQGNLKSAVKQWLSFLAVDGLLAALNQPFYNLTLKLLTGASQQRPKMVEICHSLALLSLKAHFFAVRDRLTKIMEMENPHVPAQAATMMLWFERERFQAFGNVLSLASTELKTPIPDSIEKQHDKCIQIMSDIFQRLCTINGTSDTSTDVSGKPDVLTSEDEYSAVKLKGAEDDATIASEGFEVDVQRLVQRLWDILPKAQLKKAESIWVYAMLNTDSISHLDSLERALNLEPQPIYQEGASMAMMRKIRLEIMNNPTGGNETLEIQASDVTISDKFCGHSRGTYKGSIPVFIESMYYNPSWEKIPPAERTIVMGYKAKGFSINPKPQNLRLLDCLGFFEQTQSRPGYRFVYRIPQPALGAQETASPTTLLQLLVQSTRQAKMNTHLNQPLLGDKYRLAYMLAGFLMEFHSIGWLHENFHSNNIVYFAGPTDGLGMNPARSTILVEPYIVGLHKSRPGGNLWHTEGPASEPALLDYQHPDYATTKHFRVGYDYYSLGLVLLEIGLWTPLKVWSDRKEYLTLSPHKLRDALVTNFVPRLGTRMGEVYRDVVVSCLTDELDIQPQKMEPDPAGEHSAFMKFIDRVVDPLTILSGIHI